MEIQADINLLEQQRNEKISAELKALGHQVQDAGLKEDGRVIRMLGLGLANGEYTAPEVSKTISEIADKAAKHFGWTQHPRKNWYWNENWLSALDKDQIGGWGRDSSNNHSNQLFPNPLYNLPKETKAVLRALVHTSSELHTVSKKPTQKLYRSGSLGHGILQALVAGPQRNKELEAYFPSIAGSSLMTHMRRQGVVEKEGGSQTSPYVLTELGRELLQERGIFTYDMWEKAVGQYYAEKNRSKQLPWDLPAAQKDRFVCLYYGRSQGC
jgi:hypothetical protein